MTQRRTALVVGGANGIGLAIAKQLAAAGFDLTLTAHTYEAARDAAAELAAYGAKVTATAADLSSEYDLRQLAAGHLHTFGHLDTLILSAELGSLGNLEKYSSKRWDRVFSVNVRAQLVLIQHCLPALRAAAALPSVHGSKVIAVASLAGVVSEPDLAAYSASKAALISLCQSVTLAEHWRGVTAMALSPGYVETSLGGDHDCGSLSAMIHADDVASLATALCQLSRRAIVPNLTVGTAAEILRAEPSPSARLAFA